MVRTDRKDLYVKLRQAERKIKHCKNIEEITALSNYIGNIYSTLVCMGDQDVEFEKERSLGGRKKYNNFLRHLDHYGDVLLENFLETKQFHEDFLGEILPDIEEEMMWFCPLTFPREETFQKKEFLDVLFGFMKSIHLEELFDEFYKNGHIYSSIIGESADNLGFTLYNPMNKDTDLVVKEFKYDIMSMSTLIHEFGHGYDLSRFDGPIKDYNQYLYVSLFGESISRLLERLFFRFLIENNIRKETAKDKLIDYEDANHGFLLQAYLLSLIDTDYYRSEAYIEFDSDEIMKMVKDNFTEEAELKEVIESVQDFNLAGIYNYAYGDILSMFLAEEVGKNGMKSELMDYFFEHRIKPFSEEFMRECGFGPKNYIKLYKKEIQLIKK